MNNELVVMKKTYQVLQILFSALTDPSDPNDPSHSVVYVKIPNLPLCNALKPIWIV
jgi:hypothetical protein